MAQGTAKVDIAADPDTVWQLMGSFGGLETWMPGVETCVVDGDVRTIGMLGTHVEETLFERSDDERFLTYGITGGGVSVEHHRATIAVQPTDGGSVVTWSFEVEPDVLAPVFNDVYQANLETAREKLSSS